MTEAEWFACTDPRAMLAFLGGRASERKLRLFACACARRVWDELAGDQSRELVEATEQVVDGLLGGGDLGALEAGAVEIRSPAVGRFYAQDHPSALPCVAVGSRVGPDTIVCLIECMAIFNEIIADCAGILVEVCVEDKQAIEYGTVLFRVIPTVTAQAPGGEENGSAALLREIFGNPFRPPPPIASRVRGWAGGTVAKLARAIYDERAFDRLPILADALEEAGCDDAEVLSHCRGGREHARGCWVLDLLLNRAQSGRKA